MAGRHYFYKQVEFWAERGMVSVIDHPTGEEKRLPAKTFGARAIGAWDHVRDHGSDSIYCPHERRLIDRFLEEAGIVFKEAMHQGDPTDAEVVAHRIFERSNRIVVPQLPASCTTGSGLITSGF